MINEADIINYYKDVLSIDIIFCSFNPNYYTYDEYYYYVTKFVKGYVLFIGHFTDYVHTEPYHVTYNQVLRYKTIKDILK